MPKYAYICGECKSIFDVIHSYKDVVTKCKVCKSEKSLSKFLGNPTKISKKITEKKYEIGSIVLETIEETKKEIKREKESKKKVKQ